MEKGKGRRKARIDEGSRDLINKSETTSSPFACFLGKSERAEGDDCNKNRFRRRVRAGRQTGGQLSRTRSITLQLHFHPRIHSSTKRLAIPSTLSRVP